MRFFFTSVLLMAATLVFSQRFSSNRYFEAGVISGLVNYSGDFTEKPLEIRETHVGFGVFARYNCSNRFALSTKFFTGNVSGSDAHATEPELRERSLRFNSNFLDISIVGEWNFLNIRSEQKNGLHISNLVPYLYLGVGGVMMHPQVTYFGPPGEFTQHVPNAIPETGHLHNKALMVPAGLGLRSEIADRLIVSAEADCRPVFSDQLDGVSLNGSAAYNDWYFTTVLKVSFVLARK